jgi:hypothetical protein
MAGPVVWSMLGCCSALDHALGGSQAARPSGGLSHQLGHRRPTEATTAQSGGPTDAARPRNSKEQRLALEAYASKARASEARASNGGGALVCVGGVTTYDVCTPLSAYRDLLISRYTHI